MEIIKCMIEIDLMICSQWEKCMNLTYNHLWLVSVIKDFFNEISPEMLRNQIKSMLFCYYFDEAAG